MITNILKSSVTLFFAVVGSIGSAIVWGIYQVDARDAKVVETMRIERQAQIGELKSEINGVKVLVQSVDGKVDILLQTRNIQNK